MARKAVADDLTAARRELKDKQRILARTQREYDKTLRAERKAWGAQTRDAPLQHDEWEKQSLALVHLSNYLMDAISAVERAKRAVARLESGAEVKLRVTLAMERVTA